MISRKMGIRKYEQLLPRAQVREWALARQAEKAGK